MSPSAARIRRHAQVVTAAMVVVLGGGCGRKSAPPPLPQVPKFGSAPTGQLREVEYRKFGGQAIAPVVLRDDPAPAAVAAPSGPAGPGQPATLNGDPNGITQSALNHTVQGAMGALASCFSSLTHDPMVAVSFEADPSGRPSLLRVNGAPPDAEHCIRNVIQGLRFPAFQGKGVQVDLPLSFHRVGQAAQAPSAPTPGEDQTAPLFLQP